MSRRSHSGNFRIGAFSSQGFVFQVKTIFAKKPEKWHKGENRQESRAMKTHPIVPIGLLLSTGISLFLSIDLFASLGQTTTYQWLYSGIAITLECLKLAMVYEGVQRYIKGDLYSPFVCLGLYVCLAAVSVAGSVGSLGGDNQQKEAAYFEEQRAFDILPALKDGDSY